MTLHLFLGHFLIITFIIITIILVMSSLPGSVRCVRLTSVELMLCVVFKCSWFVADYILFFFSPFLTVVFFLFSTFSLPAFHLVLFWFDVAFYESP